MAIYGAALLAFCMLTGVYIGDVLGDLIGVSANVGGVGIAMMLLIMLSNIKSPHFQLKPASAAGIAFWSSMYIPIVVAMAAKQNVFSAVSSSAVAMVAGVLAVLVSFALVPAISRLGDKSSPASRSEPRQ